MPRNNKDKNLAAGAATYAFELGKELLDGASLKDAHERANYVSAEVHNAMEESEKIGLHPLIGGMTRLSTVNLEERSKDQE